MMFIRRMRRNTAMVLAIFINVFSACYPSSATNTTKTPTNVSQSDENPYPSTDTSIDVDATEAAKPPQNITPTICPQATPEWLRIKPVTSPTNELTQTLYVSINNGETVTALTPAGEFEGRPVRGTLEDPHFDYNFIIEIELLPGTEQALTVQTKIRQIENNGCHYGGYPLSTNVDINYEPLIIVQKSE